MLAGRVGRVFHIAVRLPVSASCMGEETSVEGPCQACTPPSSRIRLPLTCGLVSGPTVIAVARGAQSSSRSARARIAHQTCRHKGVRPTETDR